MIIYRPQNGSLSSAMSEAKEFDTIDDMKKYIVSNNDGLFGYEDIILMDDSIDDTRINWHDCKMICVKRFGKDNYIDLYGCPQCIGYYATNYESNNKENESSYTPDMLDKVLKYKKTLDEQIKLIKLCNKTCRIGANQMTRIIMMMISVMLTVVTTLIFNLGMSGIIIVATVYAIITTLIGKILEED